MRDEYRYNNNGQQLRTLKVNQQFFIFLLIQFNFITLTGTIAPRRGTFKLL
jgi:hypothetical protein